MADKKPLVLKDGELQQLQSADDLALPTQDERLERLERDQICLIEFLLGLGFEPPASLLRRLE